MNALKSIFNNNFFEAVFHVAAYKHVNMLQCNKYSAIVNNVVGTKNLLESLTPSVKLFTQVSTDKAVRPINIMGVTKRISELLTLDFNRNNSEINCNVVRFGNVLHSSGSVIPIFREQISKNETVTVTDKDATRYFMTIPEAVTLILKSGELESQKEIIVLDMGEPVKILDLAKNMISLAGKIPTFDKPKLNEIKIEFIGLRDGEKVEEKLTSGKLVKTHIDGVLEAVEDDIQKINLEKIMKLVSDINYANSDEISSSISSYFS